MLNKVDNVGLVVDGDFGPATWSVLTAQYEAKLSKITVASGTKYQRRSDLVNPEFLLSITRTK